MFSRKHGMEIARQLRVGATSVNSVLAFGAISTLPFGGVGPSGIGAIHGRNGFDAFSKLLPVFCWGCKLLLWLVVLSVQ